MNFLYDLSIVVAFFFFYYHIINLTRLIESSQVNNLDLKLFFFTSLEALRFL